MCLHIGHAVISAAVSGISFPLKRRDLMLDYILALMGRDDLDASFDSSLELLHTQVNCLNNIFGGPTCDVPHLEKDCSLSCEQS